MDGQEGNGAGGCTDETPSSEATSVGTMQEGPSSLATPTPSSPVPSVSLQSADQPAWDMLTDRQKDFVRAYISSSGNAAQAALRTGFHARADGNAELAGRAMLKHYYVKQAIKEYWDSLHMSPEEVLGRLAQQARNEVMKYMTHDENGQPRIDTAALQRDGKEHLIKGIKVDAKGNIVVEIFNAQDALVHVGRSMQMFGDTDKSTVNIGVKRLIGVSEEEI